jgi:site-specific DNA-cytosine methylase
MKVLSLFDGISCGRVALERAGIDVEEYVAYEIDDSAVKVSRANYPDIIHKGDVTKADFKEYEGFDLLIGGSPCTYWSIARAGNGRETSTGLGFDLFMQYHRALTEAKPKYFLYENNQSISPIIRDMISEMLGVKPIMINSNLVSAQNRKRLYWTNIPNVSQPEDKHIVLSDIIKFDHDDWRPVGKWTSKIWGNKPKLEHLNILSKTDKSHTLTTSKSHPLNYYLNDDKTQYSNLSINEWELLQTLPIDYTNGISQTDRYRSVGNGWTVDVIAHILKNLF